MDATFFNSKDARDIISFEQINEDRILGGGRFAFLSIAELCALMSLEVIKHNEHIWELSFASTEKFVSKDDGTILELGSEWSDCDSWEPIPINPMDLAGHLLEIKHSYLRQHKKESMWILFE